MNNIEKMKTEMLKCISTIHDEIFKCGKIKNISMSCDEIQKMSEIALFEYLFLKFNNDDALEQTPYYFSCKKYKGKDNMLNTNYSSSDYITKLGIDRALKKVITLNILQNKQANNDNMKYKEQGYKTVRKQKYHFDTLAVCDWMANCNLIILNMLYGGKEPMKTMTANKRKKGNYGLSQAYEYFDKLLKQIETQEEGDENEENTKKISDVAYVSYCFALYKLEYSYRFILFAQIAKFMKKYQLPLNTKIPDLFNIIIDRLPYEGQLSYSPLVFDYSEVIYAGFINDSNEKKRDMICSYYLFERIIIKFGIMLYENMNVNDEIKWTDDFISAVANFLKNDCCVTEAFKRTGVENFNSTGKLTCFDYIRMLYTDSPLFDKTLLDEGRKKYREELKKVQATKINHRKQSKS